MAGWRIARVIAEEFSGVVVLLVPSLAMSMVLTTRVMPRAQASDAGEFAEAPSPNALAARPAWSAAWR